MNEYRSESFELQYVEAILIDANERIISMYITKILLKDQYRLEL